MGFLLFPLAASILCGCPTPRESKSADPTRTVSPVPACVKNLPPGGGDSGFSRQLPEDQYWSLLVPSWTGELESDGAILGCNGEELLPSSEFGQATRDPDAKAEGKITYGGGANRLKVVWLRSHTIAEGKAAGPLALVRLVDNHAEVYGLTSFQGDPEKVRFDLERLGGEVAVTAIEDGCSGAQGECDTTLTVFRPNAGRLDRLADIGLQRVRSTQGLEPGVTGTLQYKLTTSPEYAADGIHVIEEVKVTDSTGRNLRRAQLERAFLLDGPGVVETKESLWDLLFVSRAKEKKNGSSVSSSPQEAPSSPIDDDSGESASSDSASQPKKNPPIE